jgi:hypothetical protein
VIDWAEAAPGVFLFCAMLAFSRWRFVRFASEQKASTKHYDGPRPAPNRGPRPKTTV